MSKIKILILTGALVCCVQILCSLSFAAEKIRVVATIQTLAAIASEVGGDKVEVKSLSRGYMDPHFVEAKPNLAVDLNRADLLVHVGLELESGWLPPLLTNSRNAKIATGQTGNFEASTVVHILKVPTTKVDRSGGDIHPQGNPHFWIPPKNALAIAKGISERLSKIQPEHEKYFSERFAEFAKKVATLEKELAPQIKKLMGVKIIPYHDSWPYISDWLGLSEVGYIEIKPGSAPDPRHLAQLVHLMVESHVKIIVMEDFYNKSIATEVADKAGAKLLTLPSDVGANDKIKTYGDLVRSVVTQLSGAL